VGKGVRVSLNMRRDVVGGGQPRKSSPSYASHIAYEMISAQVLKLLFQNRNHLLEGGESADTLRPVLSSSLYASVMCTGPPFKTLLAHPWRLGSLRGCTACRQRERRVGCSVDTSCEHNWGSSHTHTQDSPPSDQQVHSKVPLRRAVDAVQRWRVGCVRAGRQRRESGTTRKQPANLEVEGAEEFLAILPDYTPTVRPPPKRSGPP
jgi:hypothetical protein